MGNKKCNHKDCEEIEVIKCHLDWWDDDLQASIDEYEYLCFAHAVETGYCGGCGEFIAGGARDGNTFCENCQDEIDSNDADFYDDDCPFYDDDFIGYANADI